MKDLILAIAAVGVSLVILDALGWLLIKYEIRDGRIRVLLFRKIPILTIPANEIKEIRLYDFRTDFGKQCSLRINNRVRSTSVVVQTSRGRIYFLGMSDALRFIRDITSLMPQDLDAKDESETEL